MSERRLWKTFYLQREQDRRYIQSVWQVWPRSRSEHEMLFHREMVETNVPLVELQQIFRSAGVAWCDHVSDTRPSEDQPQ
jgi:hypothetical protein